MRQERLDEISESMPDWVRGSVAQLISVTVSLVVLAAGVSKDESIDFVETLLYHQRTPKQGD